MAAHISIYGEWQYQPFLPMKLFELAKHRSQCICQASFMQCSPDVRVARRRPGPSLQALLGHLELRQKVLQAAANQEQVNLANMRQR